MKVYNLHLLVWFIFATRFTKCTTAVCDRATGPAGSEFCIKLPRYQDYQWATCLTDAYIKQKSKGKHLCEDRTRTYCYYQCMIEVYEQEFGVVYNECKCDPNMKPLSTRTPATLPEWCFSPDGSHCSWYRECLEKRYPCEGKDGDYAIEFAEKFCELYTKRYSNFSSMAQRWIDAVRKCLQVELVPLLRPWQTQTCEALKETAFASHTPCYLKPGANAVSFCDLSFDDRMNVFWTIKAGFTSAFLPSLKGAMDVSLHCSVKKEKELISDLSEKGKELITNLSDAIRRRFSQFILKIKNLNPWENRKKRSMAGSQEELDYFAGQVIDAVALQQDWEKKGVAWFVFSSNKTEHSAIVSIVAQLADRYTYEVPGSSHITRPSHPVDVNITLLKMAKTVKNRNLALPSIGRNRVAIVGMKGCADWLCKEFSFNVTAPPTSAASQTTCFTGISVYYASIVVLSRLLV